MRIMSEGVSIAHVCRSFEKVRLTLYHLIVELLSLETFLKSEFEKLLQYYTVMSCGKDILLVFPCEAV